jgi:uncharacterized protein (TIGR02246 family)
MTMRQRTLGLASALLLVAHSGTTLHGQAPTNAELRRLTEAYAQAWAKADAKAVTGLYTTEAIRIGADGRVAVGRAAIQKAVTEDFAGPYRGTKIILSSGQTTRAGQDVYVSEGTFQIARRHAHARPLPPDRRPREREVADRWRRANQHGAAAQVAPPAEHATHPAWR